MRHQARLEVLATPIIRKPIAYDCAQEALRSCQRVDHPKETR